MNIKLKIVEKGEPGVKGGGKKRYAVMVTDTKIMKSREFMEKVSERYHISTADIIRVLNSVSEELNRQITFGYSVELYELGIFSLSISSQLKDNPSDLKKSAIKKTRINFRPSSWLKDKMKLYEYKIV